MLIHIFVHSREDGIDLAVVVGAVAAVAVVVGLVVFAVKSLSRRSNHEDGSSTNTGIVEMKANPSFHGSENYDMTNANTNDRGAV
jgi:hypothetical protein